MSIILDISVKHVCIYYIYNYIYILYYIIMWIYYNYMNNARPPGSKLLIH